jgi:glutamate/tyrosine decarboxylase-like PLP-dependent enzyme
MDGGALLEETARKLFDHSLFNGHPRFFGYITAGPAPIGMLGDLLAAASNANVGGWVLAPAASEIEAQTIRWIGELIGFPAGEGILVSGGNMANIVAFYAARAARADWPVRAKGVAAGPTLRVYGSTETHTWIQKAADLSGIGEEAVRWIPVKRDQTMDLDALRKQVDADKAAGDRPFLVVGTAGSVSTGAIDPLPELATFCRERGLWFHVDGAYGGLAAAVPDAPQALRGLSAADSIAVDPHKWLYAPLEAGCTLVREAGRLRRAFSYRPAYYHLNEEAINFLDLGPQNSRGFRALKVWLMLRQAGASGYRRMIGDDIRLSRRMAEAIARHPDLELVTQVLSIATHRCPRGPPCPLRRRGDRALPGRAESGHPRAASGGGRDLRLERDRREPLPASRLHRELPDGGGGRRRRARDHRQGRSGGRPRDAVEAQATSTCRLACEDARAARGGMPSG